MDTSRRASRYDRFKLLVAILLSLLFLWLLRQPMDRPFVSAPTETPHPPPSPQTALPQTSLTPTSPPPEPSHTAEPRITTSPAEATFTPPALTSTVAIPSTPTPEPPPFPSNPTPTRPPSIQPTPAATSATPATVNACEEAEARSRLQPGMSAVILRRLNFRSSPGIRDNWLRTNLPGTPVEVIGGPECVPHAAGAYVWWQIKLPDGEIGWSAEGSIHGTFYFMEPR